MTVTNEPGRSEFSTITVGNNGTLALRRARLPSLPSRNPHRGNDRLPEGGAMTKPELLVGIGEQIAAARTSPNPTIPRKEIS